LPPPLRGQRERIILRMKSENIGTSVYYPQPVPRMAYYRQKYNYQGEQFPEAEKISDFSIALPVGPHLGKSEMDTIADVFIGICKGLLA
jgi:dTDP-4-amino-4,6-dideoxygalactose transaminase